MGENWRLTNAEKIILVVNLASLVTFSIIAFRSGNTEFIVYACVVLGVAVWILRQQAVIKFSLVVLWGLTLWSLMHLAGGTIRVGETVLYGVQIIPVVLRYDQFVHAIGFGVATLGCDHLLSRSLRPDQPRTLMVDLLVVLIGLGVGGVNEIVEFVLTRILPKTNVGDYENTMWDMVFNLIGAILAVTYLSVRRAGSTRLPSVSTPTQGSSGG